MKNNEVTYWDVEETAEETVKRVLIPEAFGLCAKCKKFYYQSTKYGREFFRCSVEDNPFHPSQIDQINKCSEFENRGNLELFDMWNMATMINKKNEVGFQPIDEEEID